MDLGGVSIWQLMILVIIPIYFLPTIIALAKNHRHKIPIILVNIFGGLFFGVGWIVALVWCFVSYDKQGKVSKSQADELEKLFKLKEKGVISEDEFALKKKELL